jgi:type IX secretion system PorP/SprF family membrane protein
MQKYIIAFFVLFSMSNLVVAQDPIFSQFYAAPMQTNPAFAGASGGGLISMNYRNQWPALNQAYVTYAVSYDQHVEDLNSGFGLFALADDAGRGILRTYRLTGIYSYRVKLSNTFTARLGLEAGFINPALDWNKLVFFDQIDPEFGFVSPGGTPIPSMEQQPENLSKFVFDTGVGLLLYSRKFYGGVTIKHLNNPDMGFLSNPSTAIERGLPMRIAVHAGGEFPLTDLPASQYGEPTVFFAPSVMYVNQGPFNQWIAGGMLNYYKVYGGAWYRHAGGNPESIIFLMGFRYEQFRIGYSYDLTISRLVGVSGGSHEISFSILFNQMDNRPDLNDCFQIFR